MLPSRRVGCPAAGLAGPGEVLVHLLVEHLEIGDLLAEMQEPCQPVNRVDGL